MGFGIRNNRRNGGLGAGTCGGGNGDERRDLLHDLQKSCHLSNRGAGAYHTGGCTFGRVHGGAAADGNEAVAVVFKIQLLNGVYSIDRRVGLHVGKHEVGDARRIQCFRHAGGQLLSDARSGNDNGFCHIALFQQFRNLCDTVGSGGNDRSSPIQASCANIEDPLEYAIVAFFQS